MRYRNVVTGAEFDSMSPVSAPNYQRVDDKDPAQVTPKEEKEAPKRKRSVKK